MKKIVLLTLIFLLCTIVLFGQPCPEVPCPPGGDDDPPVPLEGLSILLTAGIFLGVKKLMGIRTKFKSR